MAGLNTDRQRYNSLLTGTIKPTLGAGMLIGDGSITFSAALKYGGGLSVPTLINNQYFALILEPDTANEEVVWVTAYTSGATTATIMRGQENTTAIAHANTSSFTHGPTALDFTTLTSVQGSNLLAQKVITGITVYSTASTSTIDVDATNMAITFTAPASGKVEIKLDAMIYLSNTTSYGSFSIRESSSDIVGPFRVNSNSSQSWASVPFIISGLTPGSVHTYKWGYAAGSGNFLIYADASNQATITVRDAGITAPLQVTQLGDSAWIPFTYINSWVDYGSGYSTGAYRKDAMGFVHLKGQMKSGSIAAMTILPIGYRPSETQQFPMDAASSGGITIATDGTVSGAILTDSLVDGITFLAASSTGTLPVLINSPTVQGTSLLGMKRYAAGSDGTTWSATVTSLTAIDTTNLAVTFIAPASGTVKVDMQADMYNSAGNYAWWGLLEGATQVGTAGQTQSSASRVRTTVSSFVTGLVPGSSHTYYWAWAAASGQNQIETGPTRGEAVMTVTDAGTATGQSIVGIGDSAWTSLGSYSNSWVSFGSGQDAYYRKDAMGYVHFKGAVKSGTVDTLIATLPSAYWPDELVVFQCATTSGAVGCVQVDTGGGITQVNGSNSYQSLSGIVYLASGATGQLPVIAPAAPAISSAHYATSDTRGDTGASPSSVTSPFTLVSQTVTVGGSGAIVHIATQVNKHSSSTAGNIYIAQGTNTNDLVAFRWHDESQNDMSQLGLNYHAWYSPGTYTFYFVGTNDLNNSAVTYFYSQIYIDVVQYG